MVNLGYGLTALGRFGDAERTYRRAIAAAPDYHKPHVNLSEMMLKQGDAAAALAVCDAYLAGHRGDSGMLAFKSIVLAELGEADSQRALVDFDRFLQSTFLSGTDGFASIDDFNSAMANHILDHPSLVPSPASHATRDGRHTGDLLADPKGPVAAFERLVAAAVDAYISDLPADATHPFIASAPRRWRLDAWAVVLDGAGHQAPHIHPAAWLSGVYYVALPPGIGPAAAQDAGWIEFGRPPDDVHGSVEPPCRTIAPEEGRMLLFPSYFYHRTIPFNLPDRRISIAFDVISET